jgi:nucleoside diphosphate kinase
MSIDTARPWPAKHAGRALLGYALEVRLAGLTPESGITVPGPWDAWWACYRAGMPLATLIPGVLPADQSCSSCTRRARELADAHPPRHPGTGPKPCGCLRRWAEAMRAPGPPLAWPRTCLSLGLIKPHAPATAVTALLARSFQVISSRQVMLTSADTRRLYPEAYGAAYVRARDAYMTSGPAQVLVLRATLPGADPATVKALIRTRTGGDTLRNHLHMPDNPGEALADIAHLAGRRELAQLYRRYEHDQTSRRLAFYRAAL